jgi:hypothetical protein
MEVGITGKICQPFLARFLPSLTETSHVAWHGAPLEITEGTKGGAHRTRSLRPRCTGEVVPGPRRQSTISTTATRNSDLTHSNPVSYIKGRLHTEQECDIWLKESLLLWNLNTYCPIGEASCWELSSSRSIFSPTLTVLSQPPTVGGSCKPAALCNADIQLARIPAVTADKTYRRSSHVWKTVRRHFQ